VFTELNPSAAYHDNFHIGVIAARLEAVRRGEIKRLIINVPPRSLKSIIASVAFPAFVMGHNPSAKIIAVSYGQDLADELARDCRQVMQQAWYQKLFRKTVLSSDRKAVHSFETTSGGHRIATSVGGVLTGLGGTSSSSMTRSNLIRPSPKPNGALRTSGSATRFNPVSTTRPPAPSSWSCSACMKMTLWATSWASMTGRW
jgi:hypothetical protein